MHIDCCHSRPRKHRDRRSLPGLHPTCGCTPTTGAPGCTARRCSDHLGAHRPGREHLYQVCTQPAGVRPPRGRPAARRGVAATTSERTDLVPYKIPPAPPACPVPGAPWHRCRSKGRPSSRLGGRVGSRRTRSPQPRRPAQSPAPHGTVADPRGAPAAAWVVRHVLDDLGRLRPSPTGRFGWLPAARGQTIRSAGRGRQLRHVLDDLGRLRPSPTGRFGWLPAARGQTIRSAVGEGTQARRTDIA